MGVVKVNTVTVEFAEETSQGTLGANPVWYTIEPNQGGISRFGAEITTVERNPISPTRQRRKGTTTDLSSGVEIEMDLTLEHLLRFGEAFVYATFTNPANGQASPAQVPVQRSGASSPAAFGTNLAASTTNDAFTHDALSAAIIANTLVFTRGFTNTINNGLFVVTSGGSTTETRVLDGTGAAVNLVNEIPGNTANATMAICGRKGAVGDFTWAYSGTTGTVTSTAPIDFTKLGLTVGQFMHVGGTLAANQFAGGVAYGRIRTIAATVITLDKVVGTLTGSATDNGAGKAIYLLFGRFLRNVSTSDSQFLQRFYRGELNLPNLSGSAAFEYPAGNAANTLTINLPITSKGTMTIAMEGTDTPVPTTSRATNASTPIVPIQTTAFNTSADIVRLRVTEVDETGLTTCIKSGTLTIGNDVTNEKCLGTLGSANTNIGNLGVTLETQIQYTDPDVQAAIRNNTTITGDAILKNSDGAVAIDLPSLTAGGGDLELPENASVLKNVTFTAFQDATLGTSISFSFFPTVP